MIITNKNNLPESLCNAVDPNKHNKKYHLSATTLLHGVKDIILSDRHWDEMTDDVSNRIYALLGTAAHKIFEEADDKPGVVHEKEFEKAVGRYTVTGRIDRYDPETETIYDYKTTSVYKVKNADYTEWFKQLMTYAWLMKNDGYTVKHLCIYAILRDWSKLEAKRNSDYPQTQTVTILFDICDEDFVRIEEAINTKVSLIEKYDNSPDDEIPECTESERWAKPATFAVMKEGRKTAVRVFEEESSAVKFIEGSKDKTGLSVVARPGINPRCQEYCNCCQFCNFWKENVRA